MWEANEQKESKMRQMFLAWGTVWMPWLCQVTEEILSFPNEPSESFLLVYFPCALISRFISVWASAMNCLQFHVNSEAVQKMTCWYYHSLGKAVELLSLSLVINCSETQMNIENEAKNEMFSS